VSGPRGDLSGRDAGAEPGGHGGVSECVRRLGEWRGGLLCARRLVPGLVSHAEVGPVGHDAGSPVLLAHAMGEQAYTLHDLGRLTDALNLVRQAQTLVGRAGPPLLGCWLHAVEAETQAALADDECRRTLERSAALLPVDTNDPALPFIALNEAHHARWRGHCLAQVGDSDAIDYLTRALDKMDSSFVRATAGLRCDLAQALATQGELDEARIHLRGARLLANQVGSVRQRRRIATVGLAA
jgi:tetratricopeptide (TPR) repeat protein